MNKKSGFLLFLGFFLAGCSPLLGLALPSSSPTSASLPTVAVPATLQPATRTPFRSLPGTPTPTLTLSPTPTGTPTGTSTATLVSFIYTFPIQPSNGADFSEGVTSHGFPATDIFAPEGARVVAVTSGLVDFVSYADLWDPLTDDPALRGGLSIAILGDDGLRYYGSHLSAIEPGIRPGQRVTVGQVLGYVGHTGDARNTESHLHFGISHPTYPEDWKARRGEVDPFPFLVAWRLGQNLTPPLPVP